VASIISCRNPGQRSEAPTERDWHSAVSIDGMNHRWNLLAAIAVLALALMETLSGQSLAGYGKTIDRADDPKGFGRRCPFTMHLVSFFAVGISIDQFQTDPLPSTCIARTGFVSKKSQSGVDAAP
jgi:hypothetical protein